MSRSGCIGTRSGSDNGSSRHPESVPRVPLIGLTVFGLYLCFFSLGVAPLEVRLHRLYDVRYKLRELMKCWNNWLVLKWLSFSEAYLNERAAIASIVKIGSAPGSEGSTSREHKQ